MRLDTRTVAAGNVSETYITATPTAGSSVEEQGEELFRGIGEVLTSGKMGILQERVFGTQDALGTIRPIRARAYGPLDDGVEPSWLVVPAGINGPVAGVQVHAVGGAGDLEVLRSDGKACGRIVDVQGYRYLTLSGICASSAGAPPQQARQMLEKAESVLQQVDADMFSVPRTWIWLGDILSWYDMFNDVRNQFFLERGLIGNGEKDRMPASTGIGIGPNSGAACAMDLTAVINPENRIEYLNAGGKQGSAFDYGSAFSRASKVKTPAGTTVFVSGTASISANGETSHRGDAEAQIEATISNVRAVLKQMNCGDDDVVQAIAYCKTAEIEELFCRKWPDLRWSQITTITDICRDDLLFEMEAIAAVAG